MPNSISNTLDKTKFNLYFSLQKSFNKDMDEIIKDVKISKEIPKFLKGLDLERGIYSYGIASTDEIDIEGERVIIQDNLINGLTNPPYNKIFLSHDHEAIASGVIKFAGRIPEMDNEFYIVERINEAHPMFKNIVGSMANGNLDSYSVCGRASDWEIGKDGEKIRRVSELTEVSRTSYPGNAGAGIQGTFFVKTKQGGYSINKNLEVNQMNDELKSFVTEAIEKAISPILEKINVLEVFKKDLDDKKVEDDPKDPSAEGKDTEGSVKDKEESETPKEESEEQPSEEIQKMIDKKVEEKFQKMNDTLKPRKSAVKKEEPFEKSKKDENVILPFLNSSRRDLYDGGAKWI